MFNNFLNQIDSTSNVKFLTKEQGLQQSRGFIKPPTMNAANKFQAAAKQNSRGRKLVSTSMTIGSGIVNAYGSAQSDEIMQQVRAEGTRQVGSSLDPPQSNTPLMQMDKSRIGFNLNQALNKAPQQTYYLN